MFLWDEITTKDMHEMIWWLCNQYNVLKKISSWVYMSFLNKINHNSVGESHFYTLPKSAYDISGFGVMDWTEPGNGPFREHARCPEYRHISSAPEPEHVKMQPFRSSLGMCFKKKEKKKKKKEKRHQQIISASAHAALSLKHKKAGTNRKQ